MSFDCSSHFASLWSVYTNGNEKIFLRVAWSMDMFLSKMSSFAEINLRAPSPSPSSTGAQLKNDIIHNYNKINTIS